MRPEPHTLYIQGHIHYTYRATYIFRVRKVEVVPARGDVHNVHAPSRRQPSL